MSQAVATERVSSFSKALALGEIHEDVVFPYPIPRGEEAEKVRNLIRGFRDYAAQHIDSREIDETGTIPDQIYRDLGDLGLMGLYVDEAYGGQGLSQTGYARVFEAIGEADGSLTIGMGVHQSIGLKGIHLYGTDEQKARFLPDLAAGRKLAGFALTEPEAGSDAYNLQSRAVQQPDGSWLLNGEKRWIGNGCRGDVLTVFARAEVNGKDSHIALILEKGMEGFDQSGPRYETMGLKGNHLCSASPARASTSPCRSSTTGASAWAPAASASPNGCWTSRSTTSRRAASSARPCRSSTWSRRRSAGWSPTCSGWSRWRT
jgi:acyl-CoA dehydrogenase family protein 9